MSLVLGLPGMDNNNVYTGDKYKIHNIVKLILKIYLCYDIIMFKKHVYARYSIF
jgi:hypothetical protein